MNMRRTAGNVNFSRREALVAIGAGAATAAAPAPVFADNAFPKGAVIRTLLKDYRPEELAGGATLFHEHMSVSGDLTPRYEKFAAETRDATRIPGAPASPEPRAQPATPTDSSRPFFMRNAALMSSEMSIARSEGVACIVDAGHPDMGRDIGFLREISRRSGLPIVASAGFYSQPFYPKALASWSEERVFQELMKQVHADPIGALGEIGSWDYISKDERKVFRAVGRVHLATNLPIFTHTGIPGKSALEQLDLLEDAGVDPKHVVIGHLGNLIDPDTEVQRAIIRRGAFVGFDRQGGANDDPVVAMAMSLIDAGYVDNLMFSSDLSYEKSLKRNNTNGGYARTVTVFAPKLKKAGASDEILSRIIVDNPRRFLTHTPKIKRKA